MTRRNLRRAFLLTLAIVGIHTGSALGARWSEIGAGLPPGAVAPVATLIVDPQNGSTLYALTPPPSRSIFKSTDGGERWKALSGIAGVRVLALDPTSASTIYAGTGDGILKSTNGGESWRSAGLPDMPVQILAVDPLTPSTLYASAGIFDGSGGNSIRVYKSTDGGESWTTLSLSFPVYCCGSASITLDPLTPSTLYVVAGSLPMAIYKSTDSGESWDVINPGPFTSLLVIDPMSPSTLYAIRFGTGLSKSTDGGASWTATGFTKTSGPLTIDPRNSNILYAATFGPNVSGLTYKSTDGGWSWKALHSSFPTGRLVIDPGNSSIFYAMTLSGVLSRSTDGGARWTEINTGRRALDFRVLAGSPADPATIYAGGGEGLFKSIDSGGNWQKQDLPLSAASLFFNDPAGVRSLLINYKDPNILYVVNVRTGGCFNAENVLFKSTDGGATWNNSISPKGSGCTYAGLMGMDPADPNTPYFNADLDSFDYLLKTTDGGESWNELGLYGAGIYVLNALAIDPARPATLYAGTKEGVFKSGDGGGKWSLIGLPKTNVNLLATDPLQPNVLYASTTGRGWSPGFRGLFKSTDSGATWSPINKGLANVLDTRASVNALILDPGRTGTLYLGTSGHGVFKSSDSGATWDSVNDGLTNLDVRVLTLTRGASATVFAGTPGGVFKMVEDGN